MESYRYTRLDLEVPAFRLLQLLPGDFDDDVECEIIEAWFNIPGSQIPYEALSYTWGSLKRTEQIYLNGCSFPVTRNLFAALKRLRDEKVVRVMWIDAICIDQDDDKERGHQVQQMRQIYQNAEQVLICLGNAPWQVDILMKLLRQVHEQSLERACTDRQPTNPCWEEIWSHAIQDLGKPEAVLRQGLDILFSRQWWTRIWILQEVAHARAASILTGDHAINARFFALAVLQLKATPPSHCQAVLDLFPGRFRMNSWWGHERSLHMLLHKFRNGQASDLRDKFFALYALSSDAHVKDFPVADYHKSLHAVTKDVCSYLISTSMAPVRAHRKSLFAGEDASWMDTGNMNLTPLLLRCAVEVGYQEGIDLLMESGVIDQKVNNESSSELYQAAVLNRNQKLIDLFLAEGTVEFNPVDSHGRRLLSRLVDLGHVAEVALLLEHPDVDAISPDLNGKTPLQFALEKGDPAMIELVLCGPSSEAHASSNFARGMHSILDTFSQGAEMSRIAVITAIAESLGLTCTDQGLGESMVFGQAAECLSIVQAILCKNKNVNRARAYMKSPALLGIAVNSSHERLLLYLLRQTWIELDGWEFSMSVDSSGVDPGVDLVAQNLCVRLCASDSAISAILRHAVGNSMHTRLRQLLSLEHLDVNGNYANGLTTLLHSALEKFGHAIMESLTHHRLFNSGSPALQVAPVQSSCRTLEALLEHQAIDVNAVGKKGSTVLLYVARLAADLHSRLAHMHDPPVIPDIDSAADEYSPLNVLNYIMDTMQRLFLLLCQRDDIDFKLEDESGRSVLSYVAEVDDVVFIKVILEKPGVVLNYGCEEGLSPLSYAIKAGARHVVDILLLDERLRPDDQDLSYARKHMPEILPALNLHPHKNITSSDEPERLEVAISRCAA